MFRRYPVFIYTVGTTESDDHSSALAAVEEMAARGYVAATVEYDNGTFGSCSTLTSRARCIYDAGRSSSAIGRLGSRAKADGSRGVVVAGFSQGSIMAVRSQSTEMTGLSCPFATSCFRSNNSGWYIIDDSQVADGTADHCYMRNSGCIGLTLDSTWRSGTTPWSLRTNLNWLTQFTTP